MNFIYLIGLYIFKFLLIIASPCNLRARKWLAGRKHLFDTINKQLKPNEKRIWFHAASLGEFEQGRPVIEEIKKYCPGHKIVLTFFSPSGYEVKKDYEHADYVFYLPLDTKHNAVRFVDLIKPQFAIFIKYEFWRNFLYTLKTRQIPVYLVSGIFREEQVFFRPWGKWYRKILDNFEWFFLQNQASIDLLRKYNYTNASISGDTRFDRVFQIASEAKNLPIAESFSKDKFTIILGSSWKADEETVFEYINNANGNINFIIAPHEIHEANIQRIIDNLKVKCQRYSDAIANGLNSGNVLIIDNIGMLSSIYQYGKIAFIGGGFGSGIHNILEAATFGLPVLIGPNYKKYQEAVDLIQLGGAFEVANKDEVKHIFDRIYPDEVFFKNASAICRKYIENNSGACQKVMEFLIQRHK